MCLCNSVPYFWPCYLKSHRRAQPSKSNSPMLHSIFWTLLEARNNAQVDLTKVFSGSWRRNYILRLTHRNARPSNPFVANTSLSFKRCNETIRPSNVFSSVYIFKQVDILFSSSLRDYGNFSPLQNIFHGTELFYRLLPLLSPYEVYNLWKWAPNLTAPHFRLGSS
jgi:hypothetical protein